MEEEIPKCKDCSQPMFEVGGINKPVEIGEYRKQENSEMSIWHQTGIRDTKLYQCPEHKTVAVF